MNVPGCTKYPHKEKGDWKLLGGGKSTETIVKNMVPMKRWTIKWENLEEYEEIEKGDDINISSKSKGDLDYLKERHMKYKDYYKYLKEDNQLKGGEGDATAPSDVDPAELAMGVQVEMEHTTDVNVATEIVLDHLSREPRYYTKLNQAGLTDEFKTVSPSGYGDPTSTFNQQDRLGNAVTCAPGNNIVGTIGNTPDGHVEGKRDSTPIVNKTIDINVPEPAVAEAKLPKFPINLSDPTELKKLSDEHLIALKNKENRLAKSSNEEIAAAAVKTIQIINAELLKRKGKI